MPEIPRELLVFSWCWNPGGVVSSIAKKDLGNRMDELASEDEGKQTTSKSFLLSHPFMPPEGVGGTALGWVFPPQTVLIPHKHVQPLRFSLIPDVVTSTTKIRHHSCWWVFWTMMKDRSTTWGWAGTRQEAQGVWHSGEEYFLAWFSLLYSFYCDFLLLYKRA